MLGFATLILALQTGPIGQELSATPGNTVAGLGRSHDIAYIDGTDRYFAVYSRSSTADAPAPAPPYWPGRIHGVVTTLAADPNLASTGIPFDLDTVAVETTEPAVSFNPSTRRLLVAFIYDPDSTGSGTRDSEIYGLVLDETGSMQGGTAPFRISNDEAPSDRSVHPRIACDGADWLVVWQNYSNLTAQNRVRGCFVRGTSTNAAPQLGTAAGAPASPVTLATSGQALDYPAVAYGGNGSYLVAAYERWSFGFEPSIIGVVLGRDGAAGSPRDLATDGVTMQGGIPGLAACPATGEYLLTWSRWSDATNDADPVAQRVDVVGIPIGPVLNLDADLVGDVLDGATTPLWSATAQQYLVAYSVLPHNSRNQGGVVTTLLGARLNPDGTTIATHADLGLSNGSPYVTFISAALRGTTTQAIVQDLRRPPAAAQNVLGQRQIELGANPNAPPNPVPQQLRADTGAAIAPGGLAPQYRFTAKADVSGGTAARFEIEVRPLADALTGTATSESLPVASGSAASIDVTLAPGTAYHWQARLVATNGFTSAWVAGGAASPAAEDFHTNVNTVPSLAGLLQRRWPSATLIAAGETLDANGVILQGTASDPDADPMIVEFEVKPVGTGFDATGTQVKTAANGIPALITLDLPGGGAFHWRARAVGSILGDASPWVSFGGNGESQADFRLMPLGSSNAGCLGSAGGRPGIALLVLGQLAALLLRFRAAR